MNLNNKNTLDRVTCIQKVRIIFSFAPVKTLFSKPVKQAIHKQGVSPEDVREFARCLSTRLERIASMMEALGTAHRNWQTIQKKDRILMETESLEFDQVIQILGEKGFAASEYAVEVEYKRKWGIL